MKKMPLKEAEQRLANKRAEAAKMEPGSREQMHAVHECFSLQAAIDNGEDDQGNVTLVAVE